MRPDAYSLHEVRDDRLLKLPLEVHDVVRKADGGCHAPRVVEIVQRAAAAEVRAGLALRIQLHGQTDDVVTLLGEQRRGD